MATLVSCSKASGLPSTLSGFGHVSLNLYSRNSDSLGPYLCLVSYEASLRWFALRLDFGFGPADRGYLSFLATSMTFSIIKSMVYE